MASSASFSTRGQHLVDGSHLDDRRWPPPFGFQQEGDLRRRGDRRRCDFHLGADGAPPGEAEGDGPEADDGDQAAADQPAADRGVSTTMDAGDHHTDGQAHQSGGRHLPGDRMGRVARRSTAALMAGPPQLGASSQTGRRCRVPVPRRPAGARTDTRRRSAADWGSRPARPRPRRVSTMLSEALGVVVAGMKDLSRPEVTVRSVPSTSASRPGRRWASALRLTAMGFGLCPWPMI